MYVGVEFWIDVSTPAFSFGNDSVKNGRQDFVSVSARCARIRIRQLYKP